MEIKIETFARRENNDSAMDEDTSKNKAFVCSQQRRILKTWTESRDEVIVIIKNGKGITNLINIITFASWEYRWNNGAESGGILYWH